MEQNEISQFETQETSLTEASKSFIKEAGKWAYFLGIIGFIGVGFMVVFSIFAGSMLAAMPMAGALSSLSGGLVSIMFLAVAALHFFPVYYLFNFGKKIKEAFSENNSQLLEEGFKNLKSYYKFIGILTLCILGMYGLIFIIGVFITLIR